MLVVRGTKKLRDRLRGAPIAGPGDASTTALGGWFATALFWKPHAALLVDEATLLLTNHRMKSGPTFPSSYFGEADHSAVHAALQQRK